MRIIVKKFGTVLVSRSAGKEAYLAFRPILDTVAKDEIIEIDFEDVGALGPSWADEFMTPIRNAHKTNLLNIENPSVKATLEILEEIHTKG